MDPLSDVLALLRPEAEGWRVAEGHGAWTIRLLPDPGVVVFGQAIQGPCEVVRDDGQAFEMAPGDFFLMASPPPWELRARGGGPAMDFKALLAEPTLMPRGGDPKTATRYAGGYFKFTAVGVELIGSLMPAIIHVRAADVSTGRLGALLTLLGDEAGADRPGGQQLIKRLLEALLIEALRHRGGGWDEARSGLLAGLADAKVGQALRLMHDDVSHGWTVGELARAVGMSRSVFAARFARVVGSPPGEYLASWRMALARQALIARDTPMADVAELAGYQSVSAFSTAFRRVMGASPGRYARASLGQAETRAA